MICEVCDLLFYDNDYDDEVKEYFENNVDCSKDVEIVMMLFLGEYVEYFDDDFEEKMEGFRNSLGVMGIEDDYYLILRLKRKLKYVKFFYKYVCFVVFDWIDFIVFVVFIVDLILCFLICLSIVMYYKLFFNIIDLIVFVCGIVGFVLEKILIIFIYGMGDLDILIYF